MRIKDVGNTSGPVNRTLNLERERTEGQEQ